MRVYLQIKKRANSALILFEKRNSDNIIIAVGLAVRICDSRLQGPGSTPGLENLLIFD